MSMQHVNWAKIGNFSQVVTNAFRYQFNQEIEYRGKIKLHGTNAGVQIHPNGDVVAQSRSSLLTEHDNHGFGFWVEGTKSEWKRLAGDREVIVFGEWIGPGVQKDVACSLIPRRTFCVFAIQYGYHDDDTITDLVVDPDEIMSTLEPVRDIVKIIPWHTDVQRVKLMGNTSSFVEEVNAVVGDVDAEDPWIASEFGVKGYGEGVVYYPVNWETKRGGRNFYTSLMFKAKGSSHAVSKQRAPATSRPEVSQSVIDFVDMHVTENRLRQGLTEAAGGDFDTKQLGSFLKWVGQDVKTECANDLVASDMSWKDVSKIVTTKARMWFLSEGAME